MPEEKPVNEEEQKTLKDAVLKTIKQFDGLIESAKKRAELPNIDFEKIAREAAEAHHRELAEKNKVNLWGTIKKFFTTPKQ